MKWTKDSDRRLMAAIGAGLSIRAAARHLGISENAAIARHNRINGVRFPYDVARLRLEREETQERVAARRKSEQAGLEHMERLLKLGANRNTAILVARASGARLRVIAKRFGVTRQRIQQITDTARE